MPWINPDSANSFEDLLPAAVIDKWERLAAATDQGDPFGCGPVWNLCYHEIMTPTRRVLYETADDCFLLFGEALDHLGRRVLCPIDDGWQYGNPLMGRGAAALLKYALGAIHDGETQDRPRLILVSGVQERSWDAAFLFRLFSRDYRIMRHSSQTQGCASLAGGVDGWLSRRSANHRAKLRKAIKKAAGAGISFERVRPDPDNAAAIFSRMLAIEERSWKGIGNCGMTECISRDFYASMIARLARKRKALAMFASLDGSDLGFIFGGLLNAFYRGQQFSYAAEAAPYSIGNLLQYQQVAWLCELGAARYDMGPVTGEKMAYKLHWTEEFREIHSWILQRAV